MEKLIETILNNKQPSPSAKDGLEVMRMIDFIYSANKFLKLMKEGYYKEYSYIYDNIYSNKNYKKEFDFILKYLKRFNPKSKQF